MKVNSKSFLLTGVVIFLQICSFSVFAAEEVAGMIKSAKGNVTIERGSVQVPVKVGDVVFASDKIRTANDSSVGIVLQDETLLSTGSNSTLILQKYSYDKKTAAGTLDAKVTRGTLSVVSGKLSKSSPDAVRFSTPTTVFGVRGTEFVVSVAGDQDE